MNEEQMVIKWEHFPTFFRQRVLELVDRRFPGARQVWYEARGTFMFLQPTLRGPVECSWVDRIVVEAQPLAGGRALLTLRWEEAWEPELRDLAAEIRRHFGVEDEGDHT